ncbi:hypothetical protein [Paenibacillus sp. y28]|uniref:hypothetical protein n=1 Tax=Paenibacillus sp. y28 TaxID=3129110 RepID=UPI0030193908
MNRPVYQPYYPYNPYNPYGYYPYYTYPYSPYLPLDLLLLGSVLPYGHGYYPYHHGYHGGGHVYPHHRLPEDSAQLVEQEEQ